MNKVWRSYSTRIYKRLHTCMVSEVRCLCYRTTRSQHENVSCFARLPSRCEAKATAATKSLPTRLMPIVASVQHLARQLSLLGRMQSRCCVVCSRFVTCLGMKTQEVSITADRTDCRDQCEMTEIGDTTTQTDLVQGSEFYEPRRLVL